LLEKIDVEMDDWITQLRTLEQEAEKVSAVAQGKCDGSGHWEAIEAIADRVAARAFKTRDALEQAHKKIPLPMG
jgi:hypothetical protein